MASPAERCITKHIRISIRCTSRVCTTDSQHSDPVAPNLLQRDFTAPAPNRKWLTDMKAVWTTEG